MPAAPDGAPAPLDGAELVAAGDGRHGERPFGIYVHVPFCTVRCGYCDFNTYTSAELGTEPGASRATYTDAAVAELWAARGWLGQRELAVSTVFVGGGTPTLLPAEDLGRVVTAIDTAYGLHDGAEITVEANPESVDAAYLARLREQGMTRISFGMQSARPHVLAVLDRQHTPGRPEEAVAEARKAGFEQISLDLIYGTPGETDADWQASLDAALAAEPDHISAYSLIVEVGTQLARRIRRGEIAAPDDDVLAERYLQAEETLNAAGYRWYEVSNWARDDGARCRHNLLYWTSGDWWGVGPGAHSHLGGVRWWNLKHPSAWANRLTAGQSLAAGWEVADEETRRVERVMLELRLFAGLDLSVLDADGRKVAEQAVNDGLLDSDALVAGRAVLTVRGRLLADAVVRRLLGW